MLTTKQKMYLRKLANHLNSTFQVGKDGVNENMITDILNYLNKHELMKLNLLQTCPNTKDEVKEALENEKIEIVQVIGNTLVVYKKSINAKEPIIFN